MSISRMLNYKIGALLESMDDVASSYNEANKSESVGNMTELKAIIGQTNDNNTRFINVHGNSIAQRCIGHLSDIDTIDDMVQAHKNTFGHFEKTHQRLNDDIRMAKLAWDDLTPDKLRSETIIVKKEKLDHYSTDEHYSTEKLAELKLELAKLNTKQQRLLVIMDEYTFLCGLEDKQSKKNMKIKSKADDNDMVTLNQS